MYLALLSYVLLFQNEAFDSFPLCLIVPNRNVPFMRNFFFKIPLKMRVPW